MVGPGTVGTGARRPPIFSASICEDAERRIMATASNHDANQARSLLRYAQAAARVRVQSDQQRNHITPDWIIRLADGEDKTPDWIIRLANGEDKTPDWIIRLADGEDRLRRLRVAAP